MHDGDTGFRKTVRRRNRKREAGTRSDCYSEAGSEHARTGHIPLLAGTASGLSLLVHARPRCSPSPPPPEGTEVWTRSLYAAAVVDECPPALS